MKATTPHPPRLLACPLTSIMSNYFERLVEHHTTSIPPTFDPSQFSCQPNPSNEDKIPFALHLSLAHLEDNTSHAWMVFLDFSLAIIPSSFSGWWNKPVPPGFSCPLHHWVLAFPPSVPPPVSSASPQVPLRAVF